MRIASFSSLITVAVCLPLLIAGCGGDEAGPASSSGGSAAPTTSSSAASDDTDTAADPGETTTTAASEKDASPTTDSTTPAADPGATGTLVGTVVFGGDYKPLSPIHKAGAEGIKDGSICAKHDVPNESFLVNLDAANGVANAFVYLSKAPKGYVSTDAPEEALEMDQKGCVFLPHALVVRTGQTVLIKSDDEVPHNVHTFPTFQESFNQICQPKERDGLKLVYKNPERQPVRVQCDIHPWMLSWHLPVDHPFAAVSDSSGNFRIEGLPVGEHKFRVWHEKAGQVEKSLAVTISADAETEVTVTISSEQLAQQINPERTILLSSLKR